jgi:S-formylglutathione hydrolase FrmB
VRRHLARRSAVGLSLAALALLLSAASQGATAAGAHPRSSAGAHRQTTGNGRIRLRNAHGVAIDKVQRVGARQLQVTITPAALARPIGVRIVLPVGYRPDPQTRYPTLYLFPGTSGHSDDWSTQGGAPKTLRPFRLITVTSDIGFNGDGGSWFSNWVDRKTALGRSQWERYDIHQLIPWVDANLATVRHRSGRAVAGLSQGGYGAMEMAAQHPDLFTEVGSFSGAPEIDRDTEARAGAAAVIDATMVGLNGVEPNAPFGDHVSDEINWQGHDPARLIGNLRGIGLWLATGNGDPGRYDDPVTNPTSTGGAAAVESLTHTSTELFVGHLRHAHVPFHLYDYGNGTHSWPYWARDLRRFVTPLMHRFDASPAARRAVHYKTIQPRWSEFGWRVRWHRQQRLAFSVLSHATAHGFRLTGSGRAIVHTPRAYRPGAYERVIVGSRSSHGRVGRGGRLRIVVPLGSATHRIRVRIEAS